MMHLALTKYHIFDNKNAFKSLSIVGSKVYNKSNAENKIL